MSKPMCPICKQRKALDGALIDDGNVSAVFAPKDKELKHYLKVEAECFSCGKKYKLRYKLYDVKEIDE